MNAGRALIGALAAIPILGVLAYGMKHDPREIPSPLPGREAPAFALQVFAPGDNYDAVPLPPPTVKVGDTIALARLRGEVVVLNFFASWCLACRDEHAVLASTAATYAGKPVHFVGVLYNDAPEAGRRWITEMGGAPYPAVADPGARTAISYGLYGVPETFFIGPDGRVAYKHTGPVTPGVLTRKIDSLLALRTPAAASGGAP